MAVSEIIGAVVVAVSDGSYGCHVGGRSVQAPHSVGLVGMEAHQTGSGVGVALRQFIGFQLDCLTGAFREPWERFARLGAGGGRPPDPKRRSTRLSTPARGLAQTGLMHEGL